MSFKLTERDAELIASPRFEAVAELFGDAKKYGRLVNYGHGESFTPVLRTSGEIDNKTRIIPLQSPQVVLGEFVLTRDTISVMRRHRLIGKIAIPADELEVLRTVDNEEIEAMSGHIRSLAQRNDHAFGRSLFVDY